MSRIRFLCNYLLNKSLIQQSRGLHRTLGVLSATNKDLEPIKSDPQDLLLHKIRSTSTTNDVLELISNHHSIMNNKHIMQAFSAIFTLQKSGNTSMKSYELANDPVFKKLCLLLKSQVRSIDLRETIDALKVISFMGIPPDSTIIQILLQLIRQNVNQLSLQQIIFVEYLLKQFKKTTPLSDALLIALPIVFEVNIALKLDKDNLQQMIDSLLYVSRKKISEDNLKLLLDGIMSNRELKDGKLAMGTIWSLYNFKPNPLFKPLLRKALKMVTENADNINFSDLETTLSKVSHRMSPQHPYYYYEQFYNVVADRVVTDDLGFQQALWIQQKFNKVGHFHRGIIDYIANFCQKKDLLSSTSQQNVSIIVSAFSNSEYQPNINWENFSSSIENNFNVFNSNYNFNWIKFATELSVLNIHIPNVLKEAFREERIRHLETEGTYENQRYFSILCQAVYTRHEDCHNCLPSYDKIQYIVQSFRTYHSEDDYPLKGALEMTYGGKQYILTNCSTKFGIPIQHTIVMRKGGYPVAIPTSENKTTILDDIEFPTDSKIITILSLNPSSYCLNSHQLKGFNSLVVRLLEESGYSVVVISKERWLQLADHEKIPYLVRSIREKCDYLEEDHVTM